MHRLEGCLVLGTSFGSRSDIAYRELCITTGAVPVASVQKIASRRLRSCIAIGCSSQTAFKEPLSGDRGQKEFQAGIKFVVRIQASGTQCLYTADGASGVKQFISRISLS